MIVWIFMILDVLSLVFLTLFEFGFDYPYFLVLISGVYLIGKAAAFKDTMSIIDGICGIYFIFAILFNIHSFFYYLILIWFLYKLIPLFIN